MKASTVIIDGTLYCSIAAFGFSQGYLSTEEAYKYCSPFALFWVKFSLGNLIAISGALKMFRSTSFSEKQQDEQAEKEKLKL